MSLASKTYSTLLSDIVVFCPWWWTASGRHEVQLSVWLVCLLVAFFVCFNLVSLGNDAAVSQGCWCLCAVLFKTLQFIVWFRQAYQRAAISDITFLKVSCKSVSG